MAGCLSLLLLIIAAPALVVALRNNGRMRSVMGRMDELERELNSLRLASVGAGEGQPVASPQQEPPAEDLPPEIPLDIPEPEADGEKVPTAGLSGTTDLPTGEPAVSDYASIPARSRTFQNLEKSLGARLPVWIGAIALILSAAFLVKVSFERGWLVPQLRVAFGIIFGGVLLGAGEWLRKPAYRVSQGLSAAGIAVLFVSFYAGVNLYHLISPTIGFGFMALTAAVAVVLSMRQGMIVAVLGLVGGFLTPQLVQAGEPDPRVLFAYLFLLQGGLLVAARKKNWPGLAAIGYAGGLIWLGLWLAENFESEHSLWLGLFLVASAGLFVGASLITGDESAWGGDSRADGVTRLAVMGGLLGTTALTMRADFAALDWLFVGLMGASCIVLARLKEEFHQFAWLAAGASALIFALWIGAAPEGSAALMLGTALALGLLFGAGSYIARRGSDVASKWCTLSAGSGLAFMLLAYWGARSTGTSVPWSIIGLVLGGLYTVAALPVYRERSQSTQMEGALAALAVAATSAVSLAVPMQLERSSLAVAWAIEVTALVWLAGRLNLPVLKTLAWIVGVLVALHLVHPALIDLEVGGHLLFNWLFFMYGIPLLAFSAAAYLAAQQGEKKLSEWLQWGSIVFGVILVSLEVRQYFHPGNIDATKLLFSERGTLTIAWLAIAFGFLEAAKRWPLRSLSRSGSILIAVALAFSVFDQGLIANPAWRHFGVGETHVVNTLLWVYGLPAILLLILAQKVANSSRRRLVLAANLGALWNLLLVVTLEVRQVFRGNYLDRGTAGNAEQYSYSAAWILLGTMLLVIGIAKKGRLLRFASLAVMLLAVAKVFLVDVAKLGDLYRVFSFFGLGVSLFLLAYLYQRFVFSSTDGQEASAGPDD